MAPGRASSSCTISSTVTIARRAPRTTSFWTPVRPHSCTLPRRSARCAWITETSGLSAGTAVSSSPVNGQVIDLIVAVCAGMANRYVAGASGLPFGVLRGYVGTDLPAHTATIKSITCPFTGEELTAVPALNPDVSVIHAQRADRRGNVQMWGLTGVQKEVVLGARRAIVTVEEIVDELDARPGAIVLPTWTIDAVAVVPKGAHPSYAQDYYERDNDYYRSWDATVSYTHLTL